MKKIEIHYIGSKEGFGWYQMTWLVNKEALITIDTWYLPTYRVFAEFIAESHLHTNSINEVKTICEKLISSLMCCERESFLVDMYNESVLKEGDKFYSDIYNHLHPKTSKEPLIKYET
jgi:hypothetical protein